MGLRQHTIAQLLSLDRIGPRASKLPSRSNDFARHRGGRTSAWFYWWYPTSGCEISSRVRQPDGVETGFARFV